MQICVFLLQVASSGDFSDVSNTLLITSPCSRPHFGDILTYPHPFFTFRQLFHNFSENAFPAYTGILNISSTHFESKLILFLPAGVVKTVPWLTCGCIDPSNILIMLFQHFRLSAPPRPTYAHHTCHLGPLGCILHFPTFCH